MTTTAAAAFADPPASWENTPHVSPLYTILVLGAIPLGLFVLITLLVCLPSMSRGEKYVPGQVWRGQPEWFGGPRDGLAAADGTAPPVVTHGPAARGAVSGSW